MLQRTSLILNLLCVAFWLATSLPQSAEVRKEVGKEFLPIRSVPPPSTSNVQFSVPPPPPVQPPPPPPVPPSPPPPPPPPSNVQFVVPPPPPDTQPSPTVVGRGERRKRCPPNFQELGKECVRVVQLAARAQCASNSELTPDSLCATYSGKSPICPPDFTQNGSQCERGGTATPSQFCSPGFTLTDRGECAAPIPTRPTETCTGGSLRRGDLCVLEVDLPAELTCPPGYTLDGRKCRIEELYNCTPPRPELPPAALLPPFIPPQPQSKGFVPELIDYVVQATCKRVRTIPPEKLCPRGVLNGKTCREELLVPSTTVFTPSTEFDIRPPNLQCPNGFVLIGPTLCSFLELLDVAFTCPEGLQDVGDRCASFAPPRMVCPSGFALETNTTCVATFRAPSVTEFSVTYACVGKDCDQ